MKQVSEFLTIREKILKNSVYNKLLIAYLIQESEVEVGYSLVKLSKALRTMMLEKGKDCRYSMSPIITTLTLPKVTIGYKVDKEHIVWEYRPNIPKRPQPTSMLHTLSKNIVKYYSISAVKTDKIFSNAPDNFLQYLSINGVSPNFWCSGFPKKVHQTPDFIPDTAVINAYYEELEKENSKWALFNTILVKLVKHGKTSFSDETDGELIIEKIKFENEHLIRFALKKPNRSHYYSINCNRMNPIGWDTRDFAISINALAKFVD